MKTKKTLRNGLWNIRKKEGKKKKDEYLYNAFTFFLKLALFSIPIYLIAFFGIQWTYLESFTADSVQSILKGIMPVERNGNFIEIQIKNGKWGAFINWDCTGWKSFLAFFALVMATGYKLRKKIFGLAVFIPVLFAINIFRIAFLFYFVKEFDLKHFDIVHSIVWSWGMIFAILILWIFWIRYFPENIEIGVKKRRHKI